VELLNQSFQTVLASHATLKTQNDEVLMRVGLEQQFALQPVLKGKQVEEDERRAGLSSSAADRDQGDPKDMVGQVGGSRR
jgi:hypothetical protein